MASGLIVTGEEPTRFHPEATLTVSDAEGGPDIPTLAGESNLTQYPRPASIVSHVRYAGPPEYP